MSCGENRTEVRRSIIAVNPTTSFSQGLLTSKYKRRPKNKTHLPDSLAVGTTATLLNLRFLDYESPPARYTPTTQTTNVHRVLAGIDRRRHAATLYCNWVQKQLRIHPAISFFGISFM